MGGTFFYFGFGSNMLAKRIHIQNPTACRIGLGRLKNYRLDFNSYSKSWTGAPATIVPTTGAEVYGAIWEIDLSKLEDLDRQEGVQIGIYIPITVPVETDKGTSITCRAYHLKEQPTTELSFYTRDAVPVERQPSKSYMKTLVKGALETGVADSYVNWLKSIRHNDRLVENFEQLLELKDVDL